MRHAAGQAYKAGVSGWGPACRSVPNHCLPTSTTEKEIIMEYPATVEVRTPDHLDNWRPLVQWILALPHLIIVGALGSVSSALAMVSWVMIVFTGSLPAGLANFQVMIMRYTTRAQLYAGFLHDTYPAFDFSTTDAGAGTDPVTVTVTPVLERRNRLTVALRFIWVIPAALYVVLVTIIGTVCWIAGFLAVLFTGRWPESLRSKVIAMQRVILRFDAYAWMLVDTYPPFSMS